MSQGNLQAGIVSTLKRRDDERSRTPPRADFVNQVLLNLMLDQGIVAGGGIFERERRIRGT